MIQSTHLHSVVMGFLLLQSQLPHLENRLLKETTATRACFDALCIASFRDALNVAACAPESSQILGCDCHIETLP
jgi:hypothetical protein